MIKLVEMLDHLNAAPAKVAAPKAPKAATKPVMINGITMPPFVGVALKAAVEEKP